MLGDARHLLVFLRFKLYSSAFMLIINNHCLWNIIFPKQDQFRSSIITKFFNYIRLELIMNKLKLALVNAQGVTERKVLWQSNRSLTGIRPAQPVDYPNWTMMGA